MNFKGKTRCIGCMMFYTANQKNCPYCGCSVDSTYSQIYYEALPLCSVVGNLRIGYAVSMDKYCITYIGLDTLVNKRVLICEFFAQGYVRRQQDWRIIPSDPAYAEIIEQQKLNFIKKAKHLLAENGTVYTYRPILKRRLQKKQKNIPCEHIKLRSIIGDRSNQEDAVGARVFEHGAYAVLCDGMGGIRAGETASTECVRKMLEAADTVQYCDENIISAVLQQRAIEADRLIYTLQDMTKQRLQCGTTLLCVVVRGDHLYFVSVGDSHLYLLRNGSIKLLTEEHNYLFELMRQAQDGELDYEEAVNHPKRDALTSYVGIGNISKIQVTTDPISLNEGDVVLMCSDGLYRALNDDEILTIITENISCETAADKLIKTVEERGLPSQDNTTLILYKYSGRKKNKL